MALLANTHLSPWRYFYFSSASFNDRCCDDGLKLNLVRLHFIISLQMIPLNKRKYSQLVMYRIEFERNDHVRGIRQ